jgi:hypothetical protein
MPRVSMSNDHGDNGDTWKLSHKSGDGWKSDSLELRGYLTEGVLVLSGNRNNCVFFSPDDAIPEYNLIPNLLRELGTHFIIGLEKEGRKFQNKEKNLRHHMHRAA